jgi:hypothetical protein
MFRSRRQEWRFRILEGVIVEDKDARKRRNPLYGLGFRKNNFFVTCCGIYFSSRLFWRITCLIFLFELLSVVLEQFKISTKMIQKLLSDVSSSLHRFFNISLQCPNILIADNNQQNLRAENLVLMLWYDFKYIIFLPFYPGIYDRFLSYGSSICFELCFEFRLVFHHSEWVYSAPLVLYWVIPEMNIHKFWHKQIYFLKTWTCGLGLGYSHPFYGIRNSSTGRIPNSI